MNNSPLSDTMAEHAATKSPESYERFLALFRASTIGIATTGTPIRDADGNLTTGHGFGAGRTTHGDGQPRILAFADPEVALRNFGPRFNAGVSGAVLLQMAATDDGCAGILVNSAIAEISLVISKSTARSVLAPDAEPAQPKRHWWNRR
ncbi:hypothetical protein Val02_06330 [Virgisporangium aliadipatigenens]|uniref:Uncharacterized protein n=1 Tax=Virgisporangium aliadipatigenens TaxID=741659 RepID=A0A8J3YGD0_9ACTN|nr:hypothetical protein [Virgisporangium aliadipatigenens]GIJ43747.1 hypothetical protein Val02_06330 [Virgisporangium aliadipatigenens]